MRLRPLSESECYARCYPGGEDTVTVLKLEPRPRTRIDARLSGEELRRRFEERLDGREDEAA